MTTRVYPVLHAGHEESGLEIVEDVPGRLVFSCPAIATVLARDDVVDVYNAIRGWLMDTIPLARGRSDA